MHRIHHSISVVESNGNFANLLPWWDRLFSTYQHENRRWVSNEWSWALHRAASVRDVRLWKLLVLPFRALPSDTNPGARVERVEVTAGS